MTNLVQRVLMFFIFIPFIAALIIFFPEPKFLLLQIAALVVGLGITFEVAHVGGIWPLKSERKFANIGRTAGVIVAGMLPLVLRTLVNYDIVPHNVWIMSFMLLPVFFFGSQVVFSQNRDPAQFFNVGFGYLLILAYPAIGMSSFLGMSVLPNAQVLMLIFLASVFLNDTAAYLAGQLFGRNSPRPLKISPNKTIAGFVGGFVISVAVLIVSYLIVPHVFPGGWPAIVTIGVLMGFGTIVGDLFESGLKRSAGLKDSGAVILGRGGLLDSLDSFLYTAPIFYFTFIVLNYPQLL